MYLKEPIDICVLLLALSPFMAVRAVFYSVLLLCLCVPWPPDEHQIVQFILAFKGTASFSDGVARTVSGFFVYYSCVRAGSCHSGGGPGSSIAGWTVALDFYLEVLVWFACFAILPRTTRLGIRSSTSKASTSSEVTEADADAKEAALKGGRIKILLQYNLMCFAACLCLFGTLLARDVYTATNEADLDQAWAWRAPENFYWCRTLFGLSMYPFCILLHPQVNKFLTHSKPTGFTRLGTLQRYKAVYRTNHSNSKKSDVSETSGSTRAEQATEPIDIAASKVSQDLAGKNPVRGSSRSPRVDPVEDLKVVIKRFPCGSIALRSAEISFFMCGAAARTSLAVIAFEIRAASSVASLGLRAADASIVTGLKVARYIPGSRLALYIVGSAASSVKRTVKGTVKHSASIIRTLPMGTTALHTCEQVLQTVGFLAAAAESPGYSGVDAPPLLLAGTECAEVLKLEAASRLAELLTRAEREAVQRSASAAEWTAEAAEWITLRPDVSTIAYALKAQEPRFRDNINRVVAAWDTLAQSMRAWMRTLPARLATATNTVYGSFRRELDDLQRLAPSRAPGLRSRLEAYQRLVCSVACDAYLELTSLQGASGMLRQESSNGIEGETGGIGTVETVAGTGSEQFSEMQRIELQRRARSWIGDATQEAH